MRLCARLGCVPRAEVSPRAPGRYRAQGLAVAHGHKMGEGASNILPVACGM